MRHGRRAQNFDLMRTLSAQAPMLTADEEVRLARAANAGCTEQRDALVRSHLRLVLSIVSDFRQHNVEPDDLVSEGLLGLVEAVRRFDPDRGVRLAAYAAWWIRAYVRRYTIVNRRIVRPPATRASRKVLAHLRTVQRDLTQQHGEAPSSAEVAAVLKVDASDVEEMEAALHGTDVTWGVTPDGSLRELASPYASPEATLIANDEQRWAEAVIAEAIDNLNPRERAVFVERSLQDTPPSLASMGTKLGLSRERVRQIHEHGYQKVRASVLSSVA